MRIFLPYGNALPADLKRWIENVTQALTGDPKGAELTQDMQARFKALEDRVKALEDAA
ncbi:MAG: hypothetical protein AAFQ22_07160 [Pseudomonadota bacterium]